MKIKLNISLSEHDRLIFIINNYWYKVADSQLILFKIPC